MCTELCFINRKETEIFSPYTAKGNGPNVMSLSSRNVHVVQHWAVHSAVSITSGAGGAQLLQLRSGCRTWPFSLIAAAQMTPYWQNNCVDYFPFSLACRLERGLWAVNPTIPLSMQEKWRFPASQSAHERAGRIETWLTASMCLQSWQAGAIYTADCSW